MNPPLEMDLLLVQRATQDFTNPLRLHGLTLGSGRYIPRFNAAIDLIFGGSDGVRTRGLRVKSPSLYLTKLQTQLPVWGFLYNNSDWLS